MEGAPGAQVPGWGEGTGREEGPTAFCSLLHPWLPALWHLL